MPLDSIDIVARRIAGAGGVLIAMASFSQGGGDRVAVLLANGLVKAGVSTRLVLMKDGGGGEAALSTLLRPEVSVVSAGPPMGFRFSDSSPPLGHQHLERVRGIRAIAREIDNFRPAVVFAGADNIALTTALARPLATHRPAFAMKLTSALFRPETTKMRRYFRHQLFGFVFRSNDLVMTLSRQEREQLQQLFRCRRTSFREVANPYVTPDMLTLPRQRPVSGPPHILTAGRLVRSKRFDLLLRAFAQVHDRRALLTILGDGPLRGELVELAAFLAVSERVRFVGFEANILPWLREADLFVLSSDYEGLPAVLIEALACAVPVVTTDSFIAARSIIGNLPSCGVVPRGDPHALAEAIDLSLDEGPVEVERLRQAALPYEVDAAVAAHIRLLSESLVSSRRSDLPTAEDATPSLPLQRLQAASFRLRNRTEGD